MSYNNLRLSVLMALLLLSTSLLSQSIPIQLMVVDQNGFEKANHSVKLRLTLTNDTSSSTGQYQEVHLTTTNDFGIVSALIGTGVATTNSSVYGIEQFSFNATEPLIKIELDTSFTSNQYYTIGAVKYSYPMMSQRALKADSSSYSQNAAVASFADSSSYSLNAVAAIFADTAEFARNFDETIDNDTSAENELQDLSYDQSTNTLSISKGSTIQLQGSNPKIELEGVLEEVSNQSNWSASNWIAADSLYLYATSYLTSYNVLKKVLISNPDSVVSTINVGFPIVAIYPADSLVFGVNRTYPTYSIYSCGLDGSNSILKYIGPSAYYSRSYSGKGSEVSFMVHYNNNAAPFLMKWNLDSNSTVTTTLNSYRGHTKDYVFERYYVSGSVGYRTRSINRWDNSIFEFGSDVAYYTITNSGFDSTGTKLLKYSSYFSNGFSQSDFSYYDDASPVSGGGLSGFTGATLSYIEGPDGFGIVKALKSANASSGDLSQYEKLFLMNVNDIGEEVAVSKLIVEDWESTHHEGFGTPNVIFGHNEVLVIWSDARNIFVNNAYHTGSFIYRVPFNKDDF